MTILLINLKRIFKNRIMAFVLVILPVLFLIFGCTSIFSESQKIKIGISDLDKTVYTKMFTNNLARQTIIKEITSDQIQNELINSKSDYVVEIEKGFTAGLLKGEDVQAKGYYLKDSSQALPLQKYVADYFSSAKRIAEAVKGDEQKFYEGLTLANTDYKVLTEIERQKSYAALGMFLEIFLFTTVIYTTLILIDKENKTFYRILTTPVSLRSYMFQNILSFLLVSVIQVTIVFIVLKGLMHIYMGNSFINMYLLFLAGSVLAVSLGVAVSSFSKSVIQATFIGLSIAFLMGSFGGCMWEHETATALINNIGKFTPAYWIMDGVSKLLKNQGLLAISGDIFIVFLFALVLFFLGTWKKEDIAK
ncbi:MAG TPA: ABC transporter permease [Desulfitobacteriaceae bacterium]|nr:ABC transporter permease [Desulfitobacteriaceae bacterium]